MQTREPDARTDALARSVIGAAIEVHRTLGPGYLFVTGSTEWSSPPARAHEHLLNRQGAKFAKDGISACSLRNGTWARTRGELYSVV
jgi:hypothetical protein